MNGEKINGYTVEEARELVDFVAEGKKEGRALCYLFASFGQSHGRAKGSVRNYYYNLLKSDDERVVKLLDGKSLSVEKIRAFSEEETDEVLRSILAEKSKGMSVRRAIQNIAAGDAKKMLRLQNKYRNVLKKQPERVREIADKLGVKTRCEPAVPAVPSRDALRLRLEEEIDRLCERLTAPLREENRRLKAEIEILRGKHKGA